MKDIPYSKEQLMRANMKLMEQNKRYRKALEEIRNYGTYELNNALKTGYAWIAHEALEEDNEPLRAEVSE